MFNTFYRIKVGQRLALGFSVVIALMVVLTAVSVQRVVQIGSGPGEVTQLNSTKQRYAINFRGSVHDRAIALRDVVLREPLAEVAKVEDAILALGKKYADSAQKLDALMASGTVDPEEVRILAAIKQTETRTLPLIEHVKQLRAKGEAEQAKQVLLGQAAPEFVTWLGQINQFIDLEEAKNKQEVVAASTASKAFGKLMMVLCAGVVIIGAAVGIALTRSVTRPLRQATQVAERVGRGDLSTVIASHAQQRDEIGQLLDSMHRMQEQLRAYSEAQMAMAQRHEAGEISCRIDEASFPGDYGRMARGTNSLVAAHIAVQMKVVQIMGRYAVGDLSEDMDRLPGEKAIITGTMDTVKANLSAMNNQIRQLAVAAADGNFTVRGDVERFQYDFREMVESLNRLMAVADSNLEALSSLLRAIASGDLTARMKGDFRGVFAQMRDDANQTAEQLSGIVGRIQRVSSSISVAAEEIAGGSNDMSCRTDEQAESLRDTAASMEQFTGTVKQNAEHARQANQFAIGAATVATQGGELVGQVVKTMSGIETSSRKIAEIISVIDGIAFQTNILALNAAVEAARAGEQGRGFAVVASEVRTLAQRSANAAKEIKSLIDDSALRVADGSALVKQAGQTMQELVGSVRRVTDIMGEISSASQEQSVGIEQVNQTISRMEQATLQNSGAVKEAMGSATALQTQVLQLNEEMALFKLDATLAAPLPAPPARLPAAAAKAQVKRPVSAERRPPMHVVAASSESQWEEF